MQRLRHLFTRRMFVRLVIIIFILENGIFLEQSFVSHPDEMIMTLSKVQNGHSQILSATNTSLTERVDEGYRYINGLAYVPTPPMAFINNNTPTYPATYYTYLVLFKHWGITVETARTNSVTPVFTFSTIFNIPEKQTSVLAISWDDWHLFMNDGNTFPQISH